MFSLIFKEITPSRKKFWLINHGPVKTQGFLLFCIISMKNNNNVELF